MKSLALVFAFFIIVVGLVGLVAPDYLLTAGRYVITPAGLYSISALRVVIGLVLILVAPASRMPRILRAIGAIVLVAGLATPFFGVDRARAIVDWAAVQGPVLLRGVAVLMLVLGSVIAFAVGTGRRPA